MPAMSHHQLEAAQRFVDGLLKHSATAADADPVLTDRLVRIESVLRRAYGAFVELRAQQEASAEELARIRDRLRVVEALVVGQPLPPAAGSSLRERWSRWRAFMPHK